MASAKDLLVEPWYKREQWKAHSAIFETVKRLGKNQSAERDRQLDNLRSYMDRDISGFGAGMVEASAGDHATGWKPIRLNVSRAAVDTAHARMCASSPRIQVVTTSGNWSLHTKARQMQRFIDGLWADTGLYEQTAEQDLDSKVFGDGFVKVGAEIAKDGTGSITHERQFSPEILVDNQACLTTEPPDLFQQKWMPASRVKGKFTVKELLSRRPKAERAVEFVEKFVDNSTKPASGIGHGPVVTALVETLEAWYLDPVPGGKDGRHVICVEEGTLVDEPWPFPWFPLVKQSWRKPPIGWKGQGIMEEASGLQGEIDELAQKEQRAFYYGSIPWILKPAQCEIPDEFFDNDDEGPPPILEYSGTNPPDIKMPHPVSAELIQEKYTLGEFLLQMVGVSGMEAKAERPQGQWSGKALQHLSNVATLRFADKERHRDQVHLTIAKRDIAMARWMAENGIKLKVAYRGKSTLEKLDWKNVVMPEDDYRLEVFPSSSLPKEPAARIAYVQELVSIGWLDQDTAVQLIDMPDLDSASNIRLAAVRHIQWVVDRILYEGGKADDVPPDPVMDLASAIKWARGSYLYAQQMGADQEILDELMEWIVNAKDTQETDAQAAMRAQQGLAAGGAQIPQQLQPEPTLPGAAMAGQGGMPGSPVGPLS